MEYWSWIIAWNNVVTDGGPNLLGSIWDFTPSPDPDSGNAYSYDDGTPVPDLNFGSWKEGAEDIFSQTFATVPNTIYRYSFHYYNRGDYYNEDGVNYGSPSGLDVSANADAASAPLVVPVVQPSAGAVPEPSAWALMIAGVGLTGAVLRGRRKALPA